MLWVTVTDCMKEHITHSSNTSYSTTLTSFVDLVNLFECCQVALPWLLVNISATDWLTTYVIELFLFHTKSKNQWGQVENNLKPWHIYDRNFTKVTKHSIILISTKQTIHDNYVSATVTDSDSYWILHFILLLVW